MRFYEFKTIKPIGPTKPLTPAQTRIKALKAQAKNAQAAIKAERARQKIQAGQQDLAKIESTHKMQSNSYKAQYKMNNAYTVWILWIKKEMLLLVYAKHSTYVKDQIE